MSDGSTTPGPPQEPQGRADGPSWSQGHSWQEPQGEAAAQQPQPQPDREAPSAGPRYGRMLEPGQQDPRGEAWGDVRGDVRPQAPRGGHGRPAQRPSGRGPAGRRGRRRSPMAVTWALIGINVVVYGLQWLLMLLGWNPISLLGLAPAYVGQMPWTFVTSGFAHSMGNPFHLILNMYTLWLFGRMLETEVGHGRFLLVYLLSLLGGSTAVVLLSSPLILTVGASGAVFGLFGAMLAFALWGPHEHRQNLSGIVVLIALNAVFSVLVPGISWQGHLGGLVVGAVVMGILLAMDRRSRRTRR